jgi:hypothetical protein
MDIPRYNFTSASNKISVVNSELNNKKMAFEQVYMRFLEKYSKYGKYNHQFKPIPVKQFIL